MVIEIAEVYEQGTGKLIATYEYEVPDVEPVRNLETEIDSLKARMLKLEEKASVS